MPVVAEAGTLAEEAPGRQEGQEALVAEERHQERLL
jgi:hypothetical protein